MDPPAEHAITRLLLQWKGGDRNALNELMPMVEAELRRLAANYMRQERPGHTLQPTALVNEAWLRISQQNQPAWEGRSHFMAIAAQYMRQVLVDNARKKCALKRGARSPAASLDDAQLFSEDRAPALVAIDDGLQDLARLDPRQAQIVDLHFFGGLTYDEIAAYLGIGRMTVIRDIRMAQVWLKKYVTA